MLEHIRTDGPLPLRTQALTATHSLQQRVTPAANIVVTDERPPAEVSVPEEGVAPAARGPWRLHWPTALRKVKGTVMAVAHARIGTALIDPGKPSQNANDESFNGKLREECLSVERFRSRAEAKVIIETWCRHFNAIRPHSSLNYLTPLEFKQQHPLIPSRAVFQE